MSQIPITQWRNPRLYAAGILGGTLGLLFYSYWFVDFLPATSRQAALLAFAVSLVGALGYFALFQLCAPVLLQIPPASRWVFLAGSALLAGYLSIAYLSNPESPAHYITFLLPRQTLVVSVPPQTNAPGEQAVITRFTTSLGDVSYGSLRLRGWRRQGYNLLLTDPSNNMLQWSGRTGDGAVLSFGTLDRALAVNISWNGQTEVVSIPPGGNGKYQASHAFSVPFYASQLLLLVLGALNFLIVCYAANLLIWQRRDAILVDLQRFASMLMHPTRGQSAAGVPAVASAGSLLRDNWLVVAALMGLALLLRVFNLNVLYPYADEYAHLLAARALLHGAPLNSVFDRSLFLVTLPVVLFQRLLGTDLWAARLPGVIFNTLAVLPLYFLTRKISRPVAVLSCLLYATSPWIIGASRNIREYAYYPFYFYAIVYGMVLYLERLPRGLFLFRDWRRAFQPDLRLLSLGLAAAPLYAVFLDARSTFKIILIAYAVFGVFLLGRFDLKSKANLVPLGFLGAAVAVGGSAYAIGFGHSALSVMPHFHIDSMMYFFPNPEQQWYFDRPMLIPALALLLAGMIALRALRVNQVPAFLATLFLAYAVFFTTFFGHYLKPRYLTVVQLWYVVLLAIGLYGLVALLTSLRNKDVLLPLTAVALCALTINVSQTLLPSFYDKQGNMPVTEEYHFNVGPAYSYLLERVGKQDVLVATAVGAYVKWKGSPQFREVDAYHSIDYSLQYKWIFPYEAAEDVPQTLRQYTLAIVAANKSGWIVLDSVTYSESLSKPLSLNTMIEGDKEIDYVGYLAGEYIWRWHAIEPSS